ncbi:MAG: histone deacetylase [Kiritimatiellae bacterium]|nr:histone deacetylase [Kiritimatiellia bacterium]
MKEKAEMLTGIVWDPIYLEHKPGYGHPERPERCQVVLEGIKKAVPPDRLMWLSPRKAGESEVLLCHSPTYLRVVEADVKDAVRCLSTGDTDVCERSLEVALMAVGGVLEAVDAVMTGRVHNAFCVVRPPGHHATPDRGMGFCIFNNVAIGARYVQRTYGIERVLIADWDVHHGNGTQEIFWQDGSVFFFSTHQWPCYPGTGRASETGAGRGKGTTLNCPFPPGAGKAELLGAIRDKLAPAMRAFQPQFVFISAGFDTLASDPIGGFALAPEDFADLTDAVLHIAQNYANGRVVSVLEGGYDLRGLERAAGQHVLRLTEAKPQRSSQNR